MITHGSLFTGIGIFDLACQNNGITNVFGCDIDPFAQCHYRTHFPDSRIYTDIRELNTIPTVDILTFGFPCQDVSNAGSKMLNPLNNGKRTSLFWEAIRLIQQSKPKFVIAENVARLRHNGLYEVLQGFAACGYNAGYAILPAAKFGSVHERERIFIIANPMCERWEAIVQILKDTLNHNSQQDRQDIFAEFDRGMCEQMESQADPSTIRGHYGNTYWLFEGLYARAAGNAIYYPVAEFIIKNVKKQLI